MAKLPPHIYHFAGSAAGPCVVVMGGVHGDEKVGVQVVEEMKKFLGKEKICGEIYLIIGNPKAVKAGKRFIEYDLNRSFGYNLNDSTCEGKRAAQIAPFLGGADYLLDIHSTSKKSIPFVYCEGSKKHFGLAEILGTKYVVSPSSNYKKTVDGVCSDNFVDRNGGVGITYECGWNKDNSLFDEAFLRTQQFLKATGVAFLETPTCENVESPIHLQVHSKIVAESGDFIFDGEYDNFDFVKKGQKIATDGDTPVFAEKDSYIIFPKKSVAEGGVACLLACD